MSRRRRRRRRPLSVVVLSPSVRPVVVVRPLSVRPRPSVVVVRPLSVRPVVRSVVRLIIQYFVK